MFRKRVIPKNHDN